MTLDKLCYTFGEKGTITVGGLDVRYVEPSDISEDRNIRVVFSRRIFPLDGTAQGQKL